MSAESAPMEHGVSESVSKPTLHAGDVVEGGNGGDGGDEGCGLVDTVKGYESDGSGESGRKRFPRAEPSGKDEKLSESSSWWGGWLRGFGYCADNVFRGDEGDSMQADYKQQAKENDNALTNLEALENRDAMVLSNDGLEGSRLPEKQSGTRAAADAQRTGRRKDRKKRKRMVYQSDGKATVEKKNIKRGEQDADRERRIRKESEGIWWKTLRHISSRFGMNCGESVNQNWNNSAHYQEYDDFEYGDNEMPLLLVDEQNDQQQKRFSRRRTSSGGQRPSCCSVFCKCLIIGLAFLFFGCVGGLGGYIVACVLAHKGTLTSEPFYQAIGEKFMGNST